MPKEAWRDQLRAEVPREEIPRLLVDLQALVARLREERDDLRVPAPEQILPWLTPLLRQHGPVVLGYIDDERYRDAVAKALELPPSDS